MIRVAIALIAMTFVPGEIQDRDPVAPSTSFARDSKVYTWVKINVKNADTVIKMRWSVGGTPIWTSPDISVQQSPSWRTWFQKTVDVPGDWKVEILDTEEKILHAEAFTVN